MAKTSDRPVAANPISTVSMSSSPHRLCHQSRLRGISRSKVWGISGNPAISSKNEMSGIVNARTSMSRQAPLNDHMTMRSRSTGTAVPVEPDGDGAPWRRAEIVGRPDAGAEPSQRVPCPWERNGRGRGSRRAPCSR